MCFGTQCCQCTKSIVQSWMISFQCSWMMSIPSLYVFSNFPFPTSYCRQWLIFYRWFQIPSPWHDSSLWANQFFLEFGHGSAAFTGFCRWLPLRASSQWWHGCDLRRQQLWTMRHFTSRAQEKLCVRSDILLRRYHCARTRSNWGEVCHHSEMQQRVGWGKPGCKASKTSPCHELSRSHCERI